MPFDRGQVGEGLLPLKTFESLAIGRPIVTISSNTMQNFSEVLYSARDDESFLNQVNGVVIIIVNNCLVLLEIC